MVQHPAEYRWSSYAANAQGAEDIVLTPHGLYLGLASEDYERTTICRDLFRSHLDGELLDEIRDALNHELVLGRSYFKDKIELMTTRPARMGIPGRPRIEEEGVEYYIG